MKTKRQFEEILERIHTATGVRTQAELAALLDIKRAGISEVKRRGTIPSAWYLRLFEKLRLNPLWLKQGIGPARLTAASPPLQKGDTSVPLLPDKEDLTLSAEVPVYSMRCCPSGSTRPVFQSVGRIVLPQAYLGPTVLVFSADNDALAPTVNRGNLAGVDTAFDSFKSGDAFAVFLPNEGVALRRLNRLETGLGFLLRADAREYPDYILKPSEFRRLLGRLVWVLRTF